MTPDIQSEVGVGARFAGPEVNRAVLSLGSNLGDRLDNLQRAVDTLFEAPGLEFVALSPVYETAPVGGPAQPDYLNVVILADIRLAPEALLERAQGIEESMQRVRDVHWGPRTLDIDIVAVDGTSSALPELTLPHPRAHERAFVLVPWSDLDGEAALPNGKISDLIPAVDHQGVRRRDDLTLHPPA
jgi:2-amino-4-hydroxy-6-hydroxymethyldihydropteridine diphosphokinase